MFAVLGDYKECVEVLLKHGSYPGCKDNSGRTALHWAAHHGNVDCLKALLAKREVPWTDADQVSKVVFDQMSEFVQMVVRIVVRIVVRFVGVV